jgi:hypothetical protein
MKAKSQKFPEQSRTVAKAVANQAEDSMVSTLNLILSGHPVGLGWDDVISLITHIGKVVSHVDGVFVFEVNHKRGSFTRRRDNVVPDYVVSDLRKFLESAEAEMFVRHQVDTSIVVIDHRAARILKLGRDANRAPVNQKPNDPHGFHRHLIHRREAHYEGERVPEDTSFFERIAHDLTSSGPIVIFGHGHGKSDEADLLLAYLHKHHPELADRVLATGHGDLSALSESLIEAEVCGHLRWIDVLTNLER